MCITEKHQFFCSCDEYATENFCGNFWRCRHHHVTVQGHDDALFFNCCDKLQAKNLTSNKLENTKQHTGLFYRIWYIFITAQWSCKAYFVLLINWKNETKKGRTDHCVQKLEKWRVKLPLNTFRQLFAKTFSAPWSIDTLPISISCPIKLVPLEKIGSFL